MTRCRNLLAATLSCLGLTLCAPPAGAQVQQPPAASGGAGRSFPANALRGSVSFIDGNKVLLNDEAVRSAPGLRVFDAKNHLVMRHTLRGKTYTAHYVMEHSTRMLQTVWLISEAEAARPRATPGMVVRNFQFESQLPESGSKR